LRFKSKQHIADTLVTLIFDDTQYSGFFFADGGGNNMPAGFRIPQGQKYIDDFFLYFFIILRLDNPLGIAAFEIDKNMGMPGLQRKTLGLRPTPGWKTRDRKPGTPESGLNRHVRGCVRYAHRLRHKCAECGP
jgi:hypothetical protein